MMTKQQIKQRLGLKTDAELARLFSVSRAAVCVWGDRPIPKERWLELRYELRPAEFADLDCNERQS